MKRPVPPGNDGVTLARRHLRGASKSACGRREPRADISRIGACADGRGKTRIDVATVNGWDL
jgi:hypothetical protein